MQVPRVVHRYRCIGSVWTRCHGTHTIAWGLLPPARLEDPNAARWREHGNSAETRIFIIPTPINNNNTNVVIGLSFRLSSPTIPKGRQAAS